jgi:hypothetical protein
VQWGKDNYWKKKGLSQEKAFDKAKEPWKYPKTSGNPETC